MPRCLKALPTLLLSATVLWPSASSSLDAAISCESRKNDAVGRYTHCLARAVAKAIKRDHSPDFERCNDYLTARFQKLEAKADGLCPTTDDVEALRGLAEQFNAAAADSLAGPSETPHGRAVVIGDSMTHDAATQALANRWTTIVSNRLDLIVQNLGKATSGALEWQEHTDFLSWFAKGHVIVFLGTNDWGHDVPLADFRTAYRAVVQSAQARICITPTNRFDELYACDPGCPNENGDLLEDYRQVIREECPGTVIEGPVAVPWTLENFPDLLHFADKGSRLLAEAVIAALRESP